MAAKRLAPTVAALSLLARYGGGVAHDAAGRQARARRRPPAPRPTAALIVAFNQERRIEGTVRAALAIPGVDLALVIDDGSTDATQRTARDAGAVVVRNPRRQGRAAALEVGAAIIAMRDEANVEPRNLLLLDGALGVSAAGAAPLVDAVSRRVADLAIAVFEPLDERFRGAAATFARRAIERESGWLPAQPLSRVRCLTREALNAALPLARGAGVDPGMTIDVLRAGLAVTEIECLIPVRPAPLGAGGALVHANQYRDVMIAINARRLRRGFEATQHAFDSRTGRTLEEEQP